GVLIVVFAGCGWWHWDGARHAAEWHPLTRQQAQRLRRNLAGTIGQVTVVYVKGDLRQAFAESLRAALCAAGWSATADSFSWAQSLGRTGLRLTAQPPLPTW